jgi:octaprenyl-diphosphate synthase
VADGSASPAAKRFLAAREVFVQANPIIMPTSAALRPAPVLPFPGPDGADLWSDVQPHLAALGRFFDEQVEAFEPQLQELVRYTFANQGKRIRPTLLFYGGWHEDARILPEHVRAAAVVELVHLATLVHDDVLDEATLRHRLPTVGRKFGAQAAVLLGDALFSQALKLAADFPTVEVCRAVALATRRVCAGEIHQTLERGNPEFSVRDYFEVISLKTGELFAVSCLLGARLSGHPDAYVQAVRRFGMQLGIAYQIFDDVADFCGDEGKIGKTLGTDLASGKFTLPLLWLLERLTEAEAGVLRHAVLTGKADLRELAARMKRHGVFAAVCERFEAELRSGEDELAKWGELAPTTRLLGLASFVRGQLARVQG